MDMNWERVSEEEFRTADVKGKQYVTRAMTMRMRVNAGSLYRVDTETLCPDDPSWTVFYNVGQPVFVPSV